MTEVLWVTKDANTVIGKMFLLYLVYLKTDIIEQS